jgi:hypothetical protein
MTKTKIVPVIIALSVLLMFCDKNKRSSRRLDNDKWKVTTLTVDGKNQDTLPIIKFTFCQIYEETCTGSWSSSDGKATIAWQFRDEGKTFELSNQSDHGHSLADLNAVDQCIRFTGVYEVVNYKRKYLEVKSSKTYGYMDKTVIMIMEKQ